ncbi:MAG TPA: ornithine cyclodeaminase family protein [Anaerolineae bacterium]|nr:ornithine cyclodeaminase family protein [Anaerolineae bacterium]
MAIWLNEDDVWAVLTMADAVTAVENAFRELALGNAILPERVGFAGDGGGGAAMPAYIGGEMGGLGIKVVTLFIANAQKGLPVVQGTFLLLHPQTGARLAVMDAGYLTAVRTGAISGVAAKYLAREEAHVLTIFGAGVQARAQAEAVCLVRPIERVLVVDKNREAAEQFAAEMEEQLGVEMVVADDGRTAVEAADVIVTATTSHQPVFAGEWLRPGVHVNGIGSHHPTARELDTVTIQRAKIVVDSTAACLSEAGDLIMPIEENAITQADIHAQLGEIITGQEPGRESEAEITLFKSVGLAIQDVAVAQEVYKMAQAAGIGQELM